MNRIAWPVLALAGSLAGFGVHGASAAPVPLAFAQRHATTVQKANRWHGYQVRRYNRQPPKYARTAPPPQVRPPVAPVVQQQGQTAGGPRY